MTWIDTVVQYFKQLWSYMGSKRGQEELENILYFAMLVVRVVGMFKSTEPSPAEKREAVRTLLKFYRHAPIEILREMIDLKCAGALDNLRSYEIDIVVGTAIGSYWHEVADKDDEKAV